MFKIEIKLLANKAGAIVKLEHSYIGSVKSFIDIRDKMLSLGFTRSLKDKNGNTYLKKYTSKQKKDRSTDLKALANLSNNNYIINISKDVGSIKGSNYVEE
jgi:hypothetical protein